MSEPSADAYDYALAEMLDIHATLDRLEVPAVHDGQKLSAAQRVQVLAGAYRSACTRVGSERT